MKLFLAFAVGMTLIALPASAGATVLFPDPGDPVTADGQIVLRTALINTTCSVELDGRLGAGGLSVVNLVGTSSGCNVGVLTFNQVGNKLYGLGAGALNGTWSLSVGFAQNLPTIGICTWSGGLSGTWDYDPLLDATVLTITADSLVLVSGGVLCTGDPTVTGELELLGVWSS